MQFVQGISRCSLLAAKASRFSMSTSSSSPFDSAINKLVAKPSSHDFRSFSTSTNSSTFNFETYMHEKLNDVRKALEEAVMVKEPKKLYESMRYTLLSGRKIVPISCIAACELVGGQQSMVMPTAIALQMLNTASIIHDDLPCVDNDDIRRGIPANHKAYGEAVALFAGDALYTFAFEHMATTTKGVSPEKIIWAMAEMAKAFGPGGQIAGQVLDVSSAGMSNITLEHLKSISLKKTGAFASGFLVAGAIVGGGSSEEIERLRKFGTCLGLLLQLADDLHDFPQDSLTDRVTFPKLMGIEKTIELAEKIDEEGLTYLAGFDPERVVPLISLKNYSIYRNKIAAFNFSGNPFSLYK